MTTMFGVLVFAWVLRRPERQADSPLAAALSLLAATRGGHRETAGHGSLATVPMHPLSVPPELDLAGGPQAAALRGNRPTGLPSRPPLRFDRPPGRKVVRRQITYRLIRLSEGQDELRSREIMRLDRGDEVEIIDEQGRFMQVRTPTGAVGWIPTDSVIS